MQIHKDIKPEFVEKFQCVGPECLISCCQGWQIAIDKKTHHAYLNAAHPEIATLAKENLLRVRMGKSQYSMIKLDEQGQCPFIDGNKLCMVQRELGEKALSPTCSTYPRITKRYADETRHSMTLSCPEVARLVLFDADGMLLHEQEKLLATAKINLIGQRQPVNQVSQIIQLFAWNLLQAPAINVEENLTALAHFLVYLQRINFDLHQHLPDAERYYLQLMENLQNGVSLLPSSPATHAVTLKVRALTVLGSNVASDAARDGIIAEEHLRMAEFLNMAEKPDDDALRDKFTILNQQWQQLCQTSCLAAPHVLRNLLTYKIYHGDFPGTDLSTVMRQFYRLVLDYFYIKHLLSVKSLHETIDEAAVQKVVASLAEKTLHVTQIDQRLDGAINTINAGDDLSCLMLIG